MKIRQKEQKSLFFVNIAIFEFFRIEFYRIYRIYSKTIFSNFHFQNY